MLEDSFRRSQLDMSFAGTTANGTPQRCEARSYCFPEERHSRMSGSGCQETLLSVCKYAYSEGGEGVPPCRSITGVLVKDALCCRCLCVDGCWAPACIHQSPVTSHIWPQRRGNSFRSCHLSMTRRRKEAPGPAISIDGGFVGGCGSGKGVPILLITALRTVSVDSPMHVRTASSMADVWR